MHISGSFHYLYQSSFFCACHKLEPSFPKQSQIVWLGVSIMCPTSDTGSVDCCFCEIAPKSNFVCSGLVQRHHYHLVNKKHVLPFPKPGTGFPSTYVVVFFSNHLKRDVVVCFVVISGFYFHHCLIFLSINNNFIVYQAIYQMYWDSKILLNWPPQELVLLIRHKW
jgi:hypothetical protein